MYALDRPYKGGHSTLASCWTIYNVLAATRPDLVNVLTRHNWPVDSYDFPQPLRVVLFPLFLVTDSTHITDTAGSRLTTTGP